MGLHWDICTRSGRCYCAIPRCEKHSAGERASNSLSEFQNTHTLNVQGWTWIYCSHNRVIKTLKGQWLYNISNIKRKGWGNLTIKRKVTSGFSPCLHTMSKRFWWLIYDFLGLIHSVAVVINQPEGSNLPVLPLISVLWLNS